jgi:tetratricopeptide (TPR) repeat protein
MPDKQPTVRDVPATANPLRGLWPTSQNGVFRKEGKYWIVGISDKTAPLKNSKGLSYLAYLLRHPTAEFHVLDLVGGMSWGAGDSETEQVMRMLPGAEEDLQGIHSRTLGDAGVLIDDQAKAVYRERLTELRKELERTKALADVEGAETAEKEIEELTRELSRAVGLGGRDRRAASASERARQTVTKTIRAAVERISESDAGLGEHFKRSIKTGYFCSYRPDQDSQIAWRFGETSRDAETRSSNGTSITSPRADPSPDPRAMLRVSPFSHAERTAFVGRETERAAIRTAIDRAMEGRGSLILLGGGPGVGKTRLATEMSEYASGRGFKCHAGHCYEREDPVPYLPFVEIIEGALAGAASLEQFREQIGDSAAELAQLAPSLRRIYPDIPAAMELPPAQKRLQLFQSLSDVMARGTQTAPQLYILDDLHWADECSLTLLIHLANRVTQLPQVIIGTYRDGFSDSNEALDRTLEELIRMGVRPLKLGGLPKEAVAQMLYALGRREAPESLVGLIFEESQGNPFFVEEVYRHLFEDGKLFDADGEFRKDIQLDELDVPDNVRLVIGRRLQRLAENEKRVLEAAAVIGRSFSFQLLSAIHESDIDELFAAIEKAQQMGLIVPSAEGPETPFMFAHELVRQTLLAEISEPRRQLLHVSVADAMERFYPSAVNEHAGEMAHHLLKAGSFADSRTVIHWLKLAGKAALEAAAFEEARQSFRSALSLLSVADSGDRADLLTSLARAERGLERWDLTIAVLHEALEIYLKLGDRQKIGRSFIELTEALRWAGRFQEATETARRGLAYLQNDVSAERVGLLAALGESLVSAEAAYEPAVEALNEALNIASQLSDPKLEAGVLGARSMVNFIFFRLREAASDGLRSEQTHGSELSPWQRARQLLALFNSLYYLGRKDEAVRIGDELEALARKIGLFHAVALCLCEKAWAKFGQAPDLAKLDTDLRRILISDQRPRVEFLDALSEIQLSLVDFLRGSWPKALMHAQASCRAPLISMRGYGVGALFLQLAYGGDREAALALLDEKRAWLPRLGHNNLAGSWDLLIHVIEGLVVLGEQSQAAQYYPLVVELIDTGTVAFWPRCRLTQTIAGLVAGAAHRWEAAENHFRLALEQAVSFPNRLEQTEIHRFHAMMLLERSGQGDREKAQILLNQALESYRLIEMPRHIEMIEALMHRATPGTRSGI